MDYLWNGFKIEEFEFNGRVARIVYPNIKPNGRIVLKTEYWDAFPSFEIEMVKRGYYLCNVSHYNRWATDDEIDIMAEFVKFVSQKLGASEKCILVGMSCGGLQAAKLTEKYPHLTSVMYIDAPVLNILSLAGLGTAKDKDLFWDELVKAHGFTRSTITTYRKSPIDNLKVLLDNNVPIIMVYGEIDDVVVYEENGKVLEDYYKNNGGIIKIISKPDCNHHPHGLEDNTEIIEFVEKYIN